MDGDTVRPDRLDGLILVDLLLLPAEQQAGRMIQEARRVRRVDREQRVRQQERNLHVARVPNSRRQQRPQLALQGLGVPPGHGPPDGETLVLRPVLAEAVDPRPEPPLDAGIHPLGGPAPKAELPFLQTFDVVPVSAVGPAQDQREGVQPDVEILAAFAFPALASDADHRDGREVELGFEELLEGGWVGAEAGVMEGSAG